MKEARLMYKKTSEMPEKADSLFENPQLANEAKLRDLLKDYAEDADRDLEVSLDPTLFDYKSLQGDIKVANKSLREIQKRMEESCPVVAESAKKLEGMIRDKKELLGPLSKVKNVRDEDLIALTDLVMLAKVLEDYAVLRVKMDNYMVPDAIIAQQALDNFAVDTKAIEVEETRLKVWGKQATRIEKVFTTANYDIMPGTDLTTDITTDLDVHKKSLAALKKSNKYLGLRKEFVDQAQERNSEYTSKELVAWCKKLRSALPEGCYMIGEDYRQFEASVREALVQLAMEKAGPQFKKSVKDLEKFFSVTLVDGQYIVEPTEAYTSLEPAQGDTIHPRALVDAQKNIADERLTILTQEALLPLEENIAVQLFYKGNIAYHNGKFEEAKSHYLEFMKNLGELPDSPENVLIVDMVRKSLKSLASMEAEKVVARLTKTDEHASNYSVWRKGYFDKMKHGASKAELPKIFKAQRLAINLIKKIIEADNNVYTFEDAYNTASNSVRTLGYDEFESFLLSLGLEYTDARDFKRELGRSDAHGLTYYFCQFGSKNLKGENLKGKEYPKSLDAIATHRIVESGDRDALVELASDYEEGGMYEMSELYYDTAFKELYDKYAVGSLSKGSFHDRVGGDTEKMQGYLEKVNDFAESQGKTLSQEEFLYWGNRFINEDWLLAVRTKITNECKAGKVNSSLAREWLAYNEKLLLTDRRFWQLGRFTDKEWETFEAAAVMEAMEWGVAFALSAGVGALAGKLAVRGFGGLAVSKGMKKTGFTLLKEGSKKLFLKTLPFRAVSVITAGTHLFAMKGLVHQMATGQFDSLEYNASLQEIGKGTMITLMAGLAGSASSLMKGAGWQGMLAKGATTVALDTVAITTSHLGWEATLGGGVHERDIAPVIMQSALISASARGIMAMPRLVTRWAKSSAAKGAVPSSVAKGQAEMFPQKATAPSSLGKVWGMAKTAGGKVSGLFKSPTPKNVAPEIIGATTTLSGLIEGLGPQAAPRVKAMFDALPTQLRGYVKVIRPEKFGDDPIIIVDEDALNRDFKLDEIKDSKQFIATFQKMGLLPMGDVVEIENQLVAGLEELQTEVKKNPELRAEMTAQGFDVKEFLNCKDFKSALSDPSQMPMMIGGVGMTLAWKGIKFITKWAALAPILYGRNAYRAYKALAPTTELLKRRLGWAKVGGWSALSIGLTALYVWGISSMFGGGGGERRFQSGGAGAGGASTPMTMEEKQAEYNTQSEEIRQNAVRAAMLPEGKSSGSLGAGNLDVNDIAKVVFEKQNSIKASIKSKYSGKPEEKIALRKLQEIITYNHDFNARNIALDEFKKKYGL